MSVRQLDFAEPFFSVDYVEDESSYYAEPKSLVINLAERSGELLYVKKMPVLPLKAAIVAKVSLSNVVKALVVKDYLRCDLNDEATVRAIKAAWPSLFKMSGLPRHEGLPYYKSPKFCTGQGRDHLQLNFCFVAEPLSASRPHQGHDRDFDEVHAQIRGWGKMRIYEENDYDTYYQELNMVPGVVHDKMYDAEGKYPWHEYQSVTPCVYCPIELDR